MKPVQDFLPGVAELQGDPKTSQGAPGEGAEAESLASMQGSLIEEAAPVSLGRAKPKSSRGLMPVHHPNRDFFLCDLFDYALKDDGVSMEAPIFTLATRPDTSEWYWESKDGSRSITVTPSVRGRATQFDKDLLIYVVSQMTEALNRGRPDASSRTVRFRVYDYLASTNKPSGDLQENKSNQPSAPAHQARAAIKKEVQAPN